MGFVTAEKIEPSPITMLADFQQTISLEKRMARGGKTGLRDMLGAAVTTYNKMVTNKKHRVDSGRKAMLMNLLFGCKSFCECRNSQPNNFLSGCKII